ncbi:MAG: glycosyltransferase family A protein [Myxococcota bacterium]|nr:glycosyltransferase family A protein [Myxococcota bacterium]
MRCSPVTVIIPTFNRAHVLERALDSVYAQSAAPAEVIVVDDGSTDATSTLVKERFPGARYCYQSNQGVSAARNRGISMATQPWVAFLDSDDEWLPKKLKRQGEALEENPGYLFCHTDEIWIRRGRRVNPMNKHAKPEGWIFPECLPLCCVSPSSVMLHRDLLEEVGGFDESLPACEDYDLWLRVASRYPVLLVDELLINKYGGHEDQLSHKHWGMDRFRIQALEKVLHGSELGEENRRLAREMLTNKLEIFLQGAKKRGRDDAETRGFHERLTFWRLNEDRRDSQGEGAHG